MEIIIPSYLVKGNVLAESSPLSDQSDPFLFFRRVTAGLTLTLRKSAVRLHPNCDGVRNYKRRVVQGVSNAKITAAHAYGRGDVWGISRGRMRGY